MITQKDIIDVLDKQLLEGMGVLLTEEEQLKCEESVCDLVYTVIADQNRIVSSFIYFVNTFFSRCHSCSYNRFPLKLTKRLLAVHEAGHILLAHLFTRFDWHAFSQLLPGGKVHILNGTGDCFNYAFILEVFAIELAFNQPILFRAG